MLSMILAVATLDSATKVASNRYAKCFDSTRTNAEWAGCGAEYLRNLDDILNTAWKRAYGSLDDQPSKAMLLDEQRAWLKFRDASCQFYANGSFGREGQVVHFINCRGDIITARITDLNAIYQLTHQDGQ